MDESSMIERLRVDADRIDTDDTDVDSLVGGALRQGRRRRTHRRVGAAVSGAVVAAGLAAVVLTGGVTSARSGVPVPGPAGPAVSASGTPVPTTTAPSTTAPSTTAPSTTSSPTPSVPPRSNHRVSGSPAQVRTTLADLLPASLTVTRSSAAREEGGNGFEWENNAALTVQDSAGTSYLFGGIGDGGYEDGCLNLDDCTATELEDGGKLWITSSPAGDKAGLDRMFRYDRAGGGHVWLMQRNYSSGNGPVTRSGLPLTDAEGQALVASSRWEDLFRG